MDRQVLARLRDCAEQATRVYALLPEVEGVCLFGSVARGDPHAASDIDLLVLGSEARLSPAVLLGRLSANLRKVKWSLLYYRIDELRQLLTGASPFATHLRREGQILYDRDGVLAALLSDSPFTLTDRRKELETRLAKLRVYDDLDIFRGNFLFPLSHLYSIGKSVVMLGLAVDGAPEFNREVAFAAFAERHPQCASDVKVIARLLPFHLFVTRRAPDQLPFSYQNAEDEVRNARAAIWRIAGVVK